MNKDQAQRMIDRVTGYWGVPENGLLNANPILFDRLLADWPIEGVTTELLMQALQQVRIDPQWAE